ncbi:MAG TPA: porin, partial [Planctomycetota bacterium]|nr:porin [Planctomycetota bacterium]
SWGLDGQVFSGPFSFFADFFDRSANLDSADNVHDTGETLQVGYFLVPNAWELVARTSEVDFDDADDRHEHTVGVNYYADKQNGKWQLDFSKLQNDGVTPDQNRIRLQYQLQY